MYCSKLLHDYEVAIKITLNKKTTKQKKQDLWANLGKRKISRRYRLFDRKISEYLYLPIDRVRESQFFT